MTAGAAGAPSRVTRGSKSGTAAAVGAARAATALTATAAALRPDRHCGFQRPHRPLCHSSTPAEGSCSRHGLWCCRSNTVACRPCRLCVLGLSTPRHSFPSYGQYLRISSTQGQRAMWGDPYRPTPGSLRPNRHCGFHLCCDETCQGSSCVAVRQRQTLSHDAATTATLAAAATATENKPSKKHGPGSHVFTRPAPPSKKHVRTSHIPSLP